MRDASRDIVKGAYTGVAIYPQGASFVASDSSVTPAKVTQLNFQDLIGQPTWIDSPLIQIKTVMRGDIALGQSIKLPPGVLTTTHAAIAISVPAEFGVSKVSSSSRTSAMSGAFVNRMRPRG